MYLNFLKNAWEQFVFLNRLNSYSFYNFVYTFYLLSQPFTANAVTNFIPVLITIIEGNKVLWSVLLSIPLQGLGMSEPKLFPF